MIGIITIESYSMSIYYYSDHYNMYIYIAVYVYIYIAVYVYIYIIVYIIIYIIIYIIVYIIVCIHIIYIYHCFSFGNICCSYLFPSVFISPKSRQKISSRHPALAPERLRVQGCSWYVFFYF